MILGQGMSWRDYDDSTAKRCNYSNIQKKSEPMWELGTGTQ